MNRYNCPNCGAPIEAEKCPYCGTVILDFGAIQIGAPTYVKFKLGEAYIITKMRVTEFSITPTYETSKFHDPTGVVMASCVVRTGAEIALHATAVMAPDDKTLLEVII